MPTSPTEYLTTECPNGHRVRGDVGWLDRNVRCPHCNAEFKFQRPDGTAAEVVALDGSKMNQPSVSDTGVMRILGDFTVSAVQDDGAIRHCSECGATYPGYVPICYNCNVQLGEPVQTPEASDRSEPIDFQAVNSFPFQDVPVRKVMRPRKQIDYLDLNMPLDKVLNRARTTAHTRYPVCDGSLEELVGLIHVEDIVLSDESDFMIKKIIRPLELIPETMPASEALQHLQKSGEPIALVVDEYETVIGIVTVKDVLLKSVKK